MTHSIDEARRGVEPSWRGVLDWAVTEQRLSLWEFEKYNPYNPVGAVFRPRQAPSGFRRGLIEPSSIEVNNSWIGGEDI